MARAPQVEPPCEVRPMWSSEVSESGRVMLIEGDIRADLNAGDPMGWALRKANHVILNAALAFRSADAVDSAVCVAIDIVRDYGHPDGAAIIRKAYGLHGASPDVRRKVSDCLSRIGGPEDLDLIMECVKSDRAEPSAHLRALSAFADRCPERTEAILSALCGIQNPPPQILAAIDEFRSRRA